MKKILIMAFALGLTLLFYACATEDCTTSTIFYDLEDYLVAEKDSIVVAYDHQIRVDSLIAGFMLRDSTEGPSPDNPDEIIITYDTIYIQPELHITMSNTVRGLHGEKIFSAGDSIYFGSEDMKTNYSRIMIIFNGLDSTGKWIMLQINEGKLYQDCSQW